jgi:2-dehydro-3-deoxy-D-gluconate 5-dehydrogenase
MASILDKFKLNGKVAIVTGASRGLGQAMAVALADAGADIVATASDANALKETQRKVEAFGRKCVTVAADLGQRSSVGHVMAEAKKAFSHLDILVNCAGTIRRADFLDFTEKDWDEVMRVNLDAVFFLSQAFVREAVARNAPAKIINIASMLSFQGGIRVPSYTSSKSALAGLTRLMANELASKNINVNAIAPGYMETDNTAALRADPARNTAILGRIPAGRWGSPEDLQGAVVFLASPASDYVNGYILAVDGGWLAR